MVDRHRRMRVRRRRRGSREARIQPFARNAPTIPVSTSPVPAVASAGQPCRRSHPRPARRRACHSLQQDDAAERSTARSSAWRRCASTQAESTPSRRASSPECGVSTVGAARENGSRPKSASASTTAGRSVSSSSLRTSARRSSLRPGPGRSPARPRVRRRRTRLRAAVSPLPARASPAPEALGWRGDRDVAASARNAARAASAGAPVIPGPPPTTSTDPAVYLLSRGTRAGRAGGCRCRRPAGARLERLEPDVCDLHVGAWIRAGRDPVADLLAVERDRARGLDGCAGHLAGRGVDARRQVDGDDFRIARVDRLDQPGGVRARLAREAGAEEGVYDHLGLAEVSPPPSRPRPAPRVPPLRGTGPPRARRRR